MHQATEKLCLVSRRVWLDPPGRYEPRAILIEQGVIGELAPISAAAELGPEWRVIDLGERPLLPGLINTHVHLEFSASSRPLAEFEKEPVSERLLRAIGNARVLLESGVTTARDCGSSLELLALARRPDLHPVTLPRLVMSGPPITITRGHLHMMGGEADTIAEIDAVIQTGREHGARSLKLMGSGGGMTPGTLPESAAYPQFVFDHVAGHARRADLPSVVHVLAPESIRRGALARFDSLEHCAFFVRNDQGALERHFDPAIAGLVRDSGSRVMANLSTATRALERLRQDPSASPDASHQLQQFDLMIENFGRMLAMGIPFVCGTDAGVRDTPFSDTALELVWLERGGMSSVEALRAATLEAAAALHLDKQIGRIAPGYAADLLVFEDDPLERLDRFAAPVGVMARGAIVKASGPLAFSQDNPR